ncbi:hypothetical protein [Salinibacterium sp. PAMC 21357]|uniref:hypothetical protein n=1 Tax=Salinibacterium sp. PAMC 21357 TaxID=1112215 RepID=UPI0002895805|nr:hypothetical protein [Salinibacterium sp. PAMC 21357]
MAGEIRIEPAIFPAIRGYYAEQDAALGRAQVYLTEHCSLNNAMGLLLSCLQPQYDTARDSMTNAVVSLRDTMTGLTVNLDDYAKECAEEEEQKQQELKTMHDRLTAIEDQLSSGGGNVGPGGSTGGGGGVGGGSGGGMGGGSGSVAPAVPDMAEVPEPTIVPEPEIQPEAEPEVETEPETVTEPDAEIHPETEPEVLPDPEPEPEVPPTPGAEGQPGPEIGNGSANAEVDIDVDVVNNGNGEVNVNVTVVIEQEIVDARDAEEAARNAAYSDELWAERASADPLGRSADELRLAWEAREPILVEDLATGETAFGYQAAPSVFDTSHRFGVWVPDTAASAAQPVGV